MTPEGIYLGADRRESDGFVYYDNLTKWHNLGHFWVGVCGNMRVGNLLSDNVKFFRKIKDLAGLCGSIRLVLKEHDFVASTAGNRANGAPLYGSAYMVVGQGRSWWVGSDFAYTDVTDRGFWAEGSGSAYAFGAYHMGKLFCGDGSSAWVMEQCIQAAVDHDTSCGGRPWTYFVPNVAKKSRS